MRSPVKLYAGRAVCTCWVNRDRRFRRHSRLHDVGAAKRFNRELALFDNEHLTLSATRNLNYTSYHRRETMEGRHLDGFLARLGDRADARLILIDAKRKAAPGGSGLVAVTGRRAERRWHAVFEDAVVGALTMLAEAMINPLVANLDARDGQRSAG